MVQGGLHRLLHNEGQVTARMEEQVDGVPSPYTASAFFRIVATHSSGPYGVRVVEMKLRERGLGIAKPAWIGMKVHEVDQGEGRWCASPPYVAATSGQDGVLHMFVCVCMYVYVWNCRVGQSQTE